MIKFLQKIWAFVRPYRARFIPGLICGILSGITSGLLLAAVKLVVDLFFNGSTNTHNLFAKAPKLLRPLTDRLESWLPQVTAPSSRSGMIIIICIVPAIMLLRVLLSYLSIYLVTWSAARAVADIRTKLFNHLQNLSLDFFSRASTGELISRVTSDTHTLYGIIAVSFASMVKDPVTVVALLGYQVATQPVLTLVSLVVLPLCLAPIFIYARKVRKSARAVQGHASELVQLMHESFSGNRIIKAYNLEDAMLGQFKETTKKYVSRVMRVLRANEIPSQLMEFLGACGVGLVFTYVLFLPREQWPTSGDLFTFILSIVMSYPAIKALTRLHNQLHQAQAASARVFELLDTKSSVEDPPHPVPLTAARADIHFENVDFDYGEKPVLRGVSLTVKAGQFVALVGSTGSGKTTVTNLLLRFYDPQRGAVRIGSTDIRQVAIKDLRRQIALVTQDTILFHDTIRHNIALGRPGATNDEIDAAAKHAYADEFIANKLQGYDTIVGERGIALSGGQRQRVAIARAILKDAPILVLDEATSALDTESERIVQAALEKLMQGRTTICIAHRLSTVQRADLIVVLREGRIVETGTHTELLQRGGVYQRLYELQFKS